MDHPPLSDWTETLGAEKTTRFSPLDFSLLSPDFRGLVLLNYTENLEKKQNIQWRASSGDGAPKLQISVPCRGRTCPETQNSKKKKNKCFGSFYWDLPGVAQNTKTPQN